MSRYSSYQVKMVGDQSIPSAAGPSPEWVLLNLDDVEAGSDLNEWNTTEKSLEVSGDTHHHARYFCQVNIRWYAGAGEPWVSGDILWTKIDVGDDDRNVFSKRIYPPIGEDEWVEVTVGAVELPHDYLKIYVSQYSSSGYSRSATKYGGGAALGTWFLCYDIS